MSEEQEKFDSGAVRSTLKPRFDLISPVAYKRLAMTYAEGSTKYTDNNWRKGMPFSSIINHLEHHIVLYKMGDRSEDHLSHCCFGLFALMEFELTKPELNDLYFHQKGNKIDTEKLSKMIEELYPMLFEDSNA